MADAPDVSLATPLLRSKARIPRLTGAMVPRSELLARLTACRSVTVLMVTAPAGYGKTTLAAALARQLTDCAVCWLSLDDGENDVQRLPAALTAVLAEYLPDNGRAARTWLQYGRPTDAVTTMLAQLEEAARPIVVFLDDVQYLTQPAVLAVLADLLERSPDTLHWVLLSRQQIPFATARLELEERVLRFDAADLRLTRKETEAYLRTVAGVSVDQAGVALVEQRSDGWLAGLKCALLALRQSGAMATAADLARFLRGDQRLLDEYLAAEILAHIPPELAEFLQYCALLERLNPQLCAVVSGNRDAGRLLRAAEQQQLFVQPLDEFGEWYVMHGLWRDFLLRRLRQSIPAAQRAAAVQRAAAWLVTDGDLSSALRCLLADSRSEAAAVLLLEHARGMLIDYRLTELRYCLDLLPGTLVEASIPLLTVRAWLELMLGLPAAMAISLDRIVQLRTSHEVPSDDVVVLEQAVRIIGGEQRAIFAGLWQRREQLQNGDPFVVGWMWLFLGLCFQPDLEPAATAAYCYDAARQAFSRVRAGFGELYARTLSVLPLRGSDQFSRLVEECRSGLVFAEANRHIPAAREAIETFALLGGEASFWMDRIEDADQLFAVAFADAREMHNSVYLRQAALWVTICRACSGGAVPPDAAAAAESWIDDPTMIERPLGERGILLYLVALRVMVDRTSQPVFQRAAAALGVHLSDAVPDVTDGVLLGVFTAALAGQDRPAEVGRRIEELLPLLRERQRNRLVLQLRVLSVVAARRGGAYARARSMLRRLLPDIAAAGTHRMILLYPELLPLLRTMELPIAEQLIDRFETLLDERWNAFSAQERKILALLAEGASNQTIADDLVISLPTVKWHLNRIYRRVGVAGRRQLRDWLRSQRPA